MDSHRIEAEDVTIELYEKDGSLQATSKMRKAIYDQKKSTLHAKQAIYVDGKNYRASGAGLIFHWEEIQTPNLPTQDWLARSLYPGAHN